MRLGWILLLAFGVALPATAHAQTRVLHSVGIALTGPNDRCGEQVWALTGISPGPESRGTFLGLVDDAAGATDATALVAADCATGADPNPLLATTFDAAFAAVRGWPAPNDELKNLNLRQIPIPAGNGVRAPIPLPGTVPPNPLPPTIGRPIDPITIGHWLSATGELEITCDDTTNTATVFATLTNMIPNGVYTVWGAWTDPTGLLLEVPFGGLPNTVVPDVGGDAEWFRDIDFCPMDFAPDGSELQYISLAYHGDGVSYGAVPYEPFDTRAFVGVGALPFLSTIPGGIVTFDQLGFRVNGLGGPDPADEDLDGDGVGDDLDDCPATPAWDVVDLSGCSLTQICPCEGPRGTMDPWRNHGHHVSCMAKATESFVEMLVITETEGDAVVSEAAQSQCGASR